ncbi:MAG: aliphatic sulfonate ABC transporter substrate-binding protein [Phenylobacterium sp.]|uniref:ABC transporter substrate-binding protein n=1 Tax=Phenylobacterium sp. TaxID=1871053 RepID=UPI0025EC8296|nr:ABC transporter substrate-binding protein [Phenylobacterium sp.]MBA4010312.1 aliphatic sulfonate ABC transporter substrate-binding protein [Phenylobacterium sp.]
MSVTSFSRRGLLAAGAALAACAPRGAASADVLRVATYKGGVHHLLQAAGLDQTPYKVQWAEFAGGNLITEAIDARAIDIGSMSEIPPVFVAGRPTHLRLVAVQKGDVNSQVTLVPKDSPIRTPADLKGKRIGYVRATTAQYFLVRLLAEQGLTLADVSPIALSPQDGLSAFSQGSLDAWVIYGVQGNLARSQLGARVLTTGLGRLSGNYLHAALDEALLDPPRRAAIVDHLQRVRRAYDWADANPSLWAAAQSKATGVPVAVYEQQHRERSARTELAPVNEEAIASQQTVADVFAQIGAIPAKVDVSKLWTQDLNTDLAPKY